MRRQVVNGLLLNLLAKRRLQDRRFKADFRRRAESHDIDHYDDMIVEKYLGIALPKWWWRLSRRSRRPSQLGHLSQSPRNLAGTLDLLFFALKTAVA